MTQHSHSLPASAALRLREGRAPVRERLTAMLCLTALLHAIVTLGVGFSSGLHLGQDAPQLDVLLVTNQVPEARSNEQAVYLAQRTQLGAGNTTDHTPREVLRAVERPHPAPEARRGDDHGDGAPARRHPQAVLTSTAAAPDIQYFGETAAESAAAAPADTPAEMVGTPRSGRGDAVELLLRGKSSDEHWISPDTRASQLAPYLAEWKRKVERVGTLNFPAAARAGLSGSPVVEVEIAADGVLHEAHVRRTSGYGALDQAALMILRLASPFNPFPPAVASEYSRLRFAYQWDFVSGTLRADAQSSGAAAAAVNQAPAAPASVNGNTRPP